MDVGVDCAGGDDHLLARDAVGCHACDHAWRHAVHAIRVARLADANDARTLDADVRLDDPEHWVNDQGVGDDGVERISGGAPGRLAHALAEHLSAAELELVAVDGEVLLHLGQKARVPQLDSVADRRAKHSSVLWTLEHQRRARGGRRAARGVAEAARRYARHHLGQPSNCCGTIDEVVARADDLLATDVDESDRHRLAGLEPNTGAGRHVQPHAI
mmetsp:Transcript_29521/g.95233  ORF Transcript_29521/g.95233 Transcript_29521/m.95233 type:complete len:216 (-) Transcript_29521:689-1336(-)